MADKQKARDNLTRATLGMSSTVIAAMTPSEVNDMHGVSGLSLTFVKNMQRSMVVLAEAREMQDIADDIVQRMKGTCPYIAAIPKRDRTIKVWLDGLPTEDE